MERRAGLTKQSLIAALIAAYVAPLVLFVLSFVQRIQTGGDARMCPVGSRDIHDWCTIAEHAGAFLFNFLWALYGLPFALVLTVPFALALGRLAPSLERSLDERALAQAQYGLGAAAGLLAAILLDLTFGSVPTLITALAGLSAGPAGVWAFRRARYRSQ